MSSSPSLMKQKLALGAGFFCLLFLEKALETLAIPFYQMTLGVDPLLFSAALTIPIIMSLLLAPIVGRISDDSQSRFGRRRPFIFIACWVCALCFGLTWMVPVEWSTTSQLIYFFCCSLMFYAASCFYSVPLTSLSYELTRDETERIKVMEVNSYFIKLAAMAVQWLYPLAALAIFASIFVGIKVIGWAVAIVVLGGIGMLPALFIKEQVRKPDGNKNNSIPLLENFKRILANPLMQLVVVVVFLQTGVAAFAAKMDYYVIVYVMFGADIELGAYWKAILSVGYALIAAAYIPIVSMLSRRFGKFTALKMIFMLTALGGLLKWFIYVPGVTWLLLLDPIFCAAIWTSMTILIPAMVAKASDDDCQSGEAGQQGQFAAIQQWVLSFSGVLALLAGGFALKVMGFDALLNDGQPQIALTSMRIILSLGTITSSVLAIIVIHRYQSKHIVN